MTIKNVKRAKCKIPCQLQVNQCLCLQTLPPKIYAMFQIWNVQSKSYTKNLLKTSIKLTIHIHSMKTLTHMRTTSRPHTYTLPSLHDFLFVSTRFLARSSMELDGIDDDVIDAHRSQPLIGRRFSNVLLLSSYAESCQADENRSHQSHCRRHSDESKKLQYSQRDFARVYISNKP